MITDGKPQQSGVTPGTVQAGTPLETISREDHEKALRKAVLDTRSAVLADIGRQKKAADDAMKAAQAAQERNAKLEKEREQAELESARDHPAQLSMIQERQKRRQLEAELETTRTELTSHKSRLTDYESKEAEQGKLTKAQEIAARLNVDTVSLTRLAKYTDGSAEAIEEIAKALPRTEVKKGGLKPDSNTTVGGGASWEQVRAAYIKNPYDPAVRQQFLEMRRAQGR